jgi:small subunit ribosomal protein S20
MEKKAEELKAEQPAKTQEPKKAAPESAAGKSEKKEKVSRRPSAKKRDIQSKKKRFINKSFQSKTKTAIRNFRESMQKKEDSAKLKEKICLIHGLLDKGVKKGIFKANLASRNKSRLAALLQKTS